MAKTIFSAGVRAAAAFWLALNGHDHSGQDKDGASGLPYAVDTGTQDVIVLSLSPALGAYAPGMPVYFKALYTNHGTTPTININALGAVTMVRNDGGTFGPGNITAGGIYKVIYDGTNMRLMNPSS